MTGFSIREKPTMIRSILAVIYSCIIRIRLQLYRGGLRPVRKLDRTVISIGNIVLGGTGKTPFTIYICQMLLDSGIRPAILSRGYRGTAEKRNLLVSNGSEILCSSTESGDEPWLMAAKLAGAPVAVGGTRYKSARLCQSSQSLNPDVFLLDDGFQHIQLHRDIDIVLIDATSPFGGEYVLPKGILREPLSSLERADAFIVTRTHLRSEGLDKICSRLNQYNPTSPIFLFSHRLSGYAPVYGIDTTNRDSASPTEKPPGKNAFVLAAIGNPLQFIKDLENLELNISGQVLMRDHHPFSQEDMDRVIDGFKDSGAEFIITTEKDAIRMSHLNLRKAPIFSVGLVVQSSEENKFREWLLKQVSDSSACPGS